MKPSTNSPAKGKPIRTISATKTAQSHRATSHYILVEPRGWLAEILPAASEHPSYVSFIRDQFVAVARQMAEQINSQAGETACFLVVVTSFGFPIRQGIVDVPALARNLRLLLRSSLNQVESARGVLGASDLSHGQIQAAVLVRPSRESAIAMCETALAAGQSAEPIPLRPMPQTVASNSPDFSAVREVLTATFSTMPSDFRNHSEQLAHLFEAVRMAFARQLEPAINAQAANLPQGDYEKNKQLAKWVNAEIRRFGLALRAPNAEDPCLLVGALGPRGTGGRFFLEYTDSAGRRHRPLTSTTLPHLELIPDMLERVPYGSRQARSR